MIIYDKIAELINSGWILELLRTPDGYQATISRFDDKYHLHFEDQNLHDLILKIKV